MKSLQLILISILILGLLVIYSCSISPSPQQPPTSTNTSTRGGGTSTTYYSISGTLSGSLTTQWKIYAQLLNSSKILGSINYSTSNYVINNVPQSISVDVVLFKDNNNNNQLDAGEYSILANIALFTNNITNLNFTIPTLNSYTLTFNVSNNVYGLRIGVYAFLDNSSSYWYTSSTNDANFTFNINVDLPAGANINYGVYYDLNNNSIPDFNNNFPIEPISQWETKSNLTGSYTTNIELVAHLINGNITGETTGFNKIGLVLGTDSIFYSPSLGSFLLSQTDFSSPYILRFYTISNQYKPYVNVLVYSDDGNGYLDNVFGNDIVVVSSTRITNDVPSTNIIDIHIKKVDVTVNLNGLSGVDVSQFKITDFKGILFTNYFVSPKTYSVYYDTNSTYYSFFVVFKDENGNGIFDLPSLGIGQPDFYDTCTFFELGLNGSSPSSTNLSYTIGKYNVNLTISNDSALSSYTKPAITYQGSFLYMKSISPGTSSYSLSLYYITNFYSIVSLAIVNDADGNGADSGDPIIATNSDNIFPIAATINSDTNITFWITN
ncbi:MAG: hypothetical protein ACP5PT_02140 [Brevinematia bacterium]